MSLERVSFKKGRKHEPRISAPYIPGQQSDRYWTDEENAVLLAHYVSKGFSYCATKLPGRTRGAIFGQAHKLGLRREGHQQRVFRTKKEYADLDARINEAWPTLVIPKGDVTGMNELARILDEPRWLITQRCRLLGLTRARKKEPKWSPAEEELMKNVPLHDPDKCSEIFAAHGFKRTATAIVVKAKRLNLKRRYTETYCATTAGKLLGMDSKTVSTYCLKGTLKSSRRASKRLSQQGGAPHSIERADLRQFVIDNLEMIDFRKVDKFGMVDLLTSNGGNL